MRKLYIVKTNREFEKIINTGKIKKNRSFIIYYKDNSLPYSRFGISVGKKLGNAVYRNKYKRIIRQIVDNYKKSYNNKQDYIIILRGSAKEKNYAELNNDFVTLMQTTRKEEIYEKTKSN